MALKNFYTIWGAEIFLESYFGVTNTWTKFQQIREGRIDAFAHLMWNYSRMNFPKFHSKKKWKKFKRKSSPEL